MAQDSVLQREMFNTRGRSAKGSGITSMVDDGSSGMTREERLQIAKAMLAEAQMKQSPEYYFNTLAASDRPAMTRPVASSAPPPAMQQMPAAQQMAQMQAAGVRPVGMAEGGLASLRDPRMEAVNLADLPALGASESAYMAPSNNTRPVLTRPESVTQEEETLREKLKRFAQSAGGSGDYMSKPMATGTVIESSPEAQAAGGSGDYMSKLPRETTEEGPPADKKLTELEQIKADRKAEKEKNFYLGLMQAGLSMMGGKSSDALQNIAQGGISGLQSYAGLEADSRKAEREDMASLRAQQQDEATALYRERTLGMEQKKMDRAPEAVLAAAMAGGYNPESGKPPTQEQYTQGLSVLSRSKTLSEVNDQLSNLLKVESQGGIVDPEEVKNLRAVRDQLMQDMGAGKAKPAFSGFSGTTIAP